MKKKHLGWITTLALAGLVALAGNAPAKPEGQNRKEGRAERTDKAKTKKDQLARIAAELNLTEEQKTKIRPVLQEQAEKLKALRQDPGLSKEERRAKMREIQQATQARMKDILTAEQLEKWQKLRETKKSKAEK